MKPMLAVEVDDLTTLRYPMLTSYKLDGIRAITTEEGAKLRSLDPVPNKHIATMMADLPPGLDGELAVVLDGKVDFRATTSAVRRRTGEPEFRYFVFDDFTHTHVPFGQRSAGLQSIMPDLPSWVVFVQQRVVFDADDVKEQFETAMSLGYEGLILRDPQGVYKHGRSTATEQGMIKVKPWTDAEAKIIEVLPEFENQNEAKKDKLGRTKRSSAKEGRVQKECLGKLVVEGPQWSKSFEIGTGFTRAEKLDLWSRRETLIGELVRFKYVPVGGYDVPRHCSYQGLRMKEDQ